MYKEGLVFVKLTVGFREGLNQSFQPGWFLKDSDSVFLKFTGSTPDLLNHNILGWLQESDFFF